jgi:hypothetical protein
MMLQKSFGQTMAEMDYRKVNNVRYDLQDPQPLVPRQALLYVTMRRQTPYILPGHDQEIQGYPKT